jgi:hypothetical protein
MANGDRERLLSTYGDMGAAMAVQSVLEAEGIPCRVGDLEGIPDHMRGMLGGLNRSVGVWVLESDVERAVELLGSAEQGGAPSEEALAAEALAAGGAPAEPGAPPAGPEPEPAPARDPPRQSPGSAGPVGGLFLVAAAALAFVVLQARGCT